MRAAYLVLLAANALSFAGASLLSLWALEHQIFPRGEDGAVALLFLIASGGAPFLAARLFRAGHRLAALLALLPVALLGSAGALVLWALLSRGGHH